MELLIKYKKWIIASAIVVVVGLIGLLVYRQTTLLEVTSTSPSRGSSVSYETPIITVDFNKDISDKEFKINSPKGLVVSTFIEGRRLNINIFSGLVANQNYNFTLASVIAKDGSKLANFDINFSTTASTKLSEAENNLILQRQQQNKPSLVNDPILQYVPHHTDQYNIKPFLDTSTDGKGAITLEITSYLSREDVINGTDISVKRIQKEADTYLSAIKDIVLTDYTIIYKVQQP